jgi:hypothetical protein
LLDVFARQCIHQFLPYQNRKLRGAWATSVSNRRLSCTFCEIENLGRVYFGVLASPSAAIAGVDSSVPPPTSRSKELTKRAP